MFMKKLLSLVRAAVDRYDMIDDGDKIAVGVSGGKDSLALLYALARLRSFYPKHFEVIAITLDYRFGGMDGDYSEIQKLCDSLDVKYIVKKTDLWDVIFNIRKEKNPCSLCAKMRRGILHDTAKEYGCNKIALGHHLDDAAETFMMNLLKFAYEKDVKRAAASLDLPIVKSKCPADGVTERQSTKELLASLERQYPALREKIVGALQRGGISGW